MPKARLATVAWAALAVAMAVGPASLGPVPTPGAIPLANPAPAAAGSTVSLVVDPASWWMETGANVTLAATWTDVPPGCTLEPIWFRWTIAPGGSEGALGRSNGSQTVFYASDEGTGTTTVVARSSAALDCRGNTSAIFSRASAAVTVAAPLAVDGVGFEENPVVPGATTTLIGSVVGGDPPYELRVAWGDGNVSAEEVPDPGGFSIPHAYGTNGSFSPVLLATDAAGRTANAAPEEPLNVSEGFAAAIAPSTLVAEVGVPVTFDIETTDEPQNFSWLFACPDAQPAGSGGSGALDFRCAFDSPVVVPVTFEAVGGEVPFPVATATLEEPVVPNPSVVFPSAPPAGEVGGTTYAAVDVRGGVPPFQLLWSLVGTGASGVQDVPSDGLDYVPLSSSVAGTLALSVVALDALNVTSPGAEETVVFLPALEASADAEAGPAAGAVSLNVSATVVGGAPPFDWAVFPSILAVNASGGAGSLARPGLFGWNATYRVEGSLGLSVMVVDAAGASAVLNLTVVLAPELAVAATVHPDGPGRVLLGVTVAGGVPPFAFRWNDSAGDSWNGTLPTAGTVVLREPTAATGPCSFGVTVVDALGVSNTSGADVQLPPFPPGSSPNTLGATALAVVGLLAGGGVAFGLLRRRRPLAEAPPPDPVAVLREVIEASDGVDRGLVEMLAEERGVPLEVVRSTLERLKADGSVRAGRGSDGEEVLAWA